MHIRKKLLKINLLVTTTANTHALILFVVIRKNSIKNSVEISKNLLTNS